jgi:hypothetical protein
MSNDFFVFFLIFIFVFIFIFFIILIFLGTCYFFSLQPIMFFCSIPSSDIKNKI